MGRPCYPNFGRNTAKIFLSWKKSWKAEPEVNDLNRG
jgi:hypothetical protein